MCVLNAHVLDTYSYPLLLLEVGTIEKKLFKPGIGNTPGLFVWSVVGKESAIFFTLSTAQPDKTGKAVKTGRTGHILVGFLCI